MKATNKVSPFFGGYHETDYKVLVLILCHLYIQQNSAVYTVSLNDICSVSEYESRYASNR